jgi:hypothetical protein
MPANECVICPTASHPIQIQEKPYARRLMAVFLPAIHKPLQYLWSPIGINPSSILMEVNGESY